MGAAAAPRAWQRMLSGRRLDLLDPSPLDIEIVDIAHGLARVARWNGQTHGAHVFSVAQHSLLVEQVAAAVHPQMSPIERACVLLHDAAEYVIGDMISPFKAVIGDRYKSVEGRIFQAVLTRYSLPLPTPVLAKRIKQADRAAAFLEATQLAGFGRSEATKLFGHPPVMNADLAAALQPTPAATVQVRFLQRFDELERARVDRRGASKSKED